MRTRTRQLAPRDTWPDLRITIHVFPWSWRLHVYAEHEPEEAHRAGQLTLHANLGPLEVTLYANLPVFTEDADARRCRVCGCTELHACTSGCWWVASDLCSSCAPAGAAATAYTLGLDQDV